MRKRINFSFFRGTLNEYGLQIFTLIYQQIFPMNLYKFKELFLRHMYNLIQYTHYPLAFALERANHKVNKIAPCSDNVIALRKINKYRPFNDNSTKKMFYREFMHYESYLFLIIIYSERWFCISFEQLGLKFSTDEIYRHRINRDYSKSNPNSISTILFRFF